MDPLAAGNINSLEVTFIYEALYINKDSLRLGTLFAIKYISSVYRRG